MGPMPAGAAAVRVEHPGFICDNRWNPVDGTVCRIALRKGLVIAGRVELPDGTPLECGVVRAWTRSLVWGDLAASTEVRDGAFRLTGLAPGEWGLCIWRASEDRALSDAHRVEAGTEDTVIVLEKIASFPVPRPGPVRAMSVTP